MNQQIKTSLGTIILIIISITIGVFVWKIYSKNPIVVDSPEVKIKTLLIPKKDNPNAACTQEAKLCPGGKTYVSRTGLNCEFAECPESISMVDWKKYQNKKYGFEFMYPGDWKIKFVQDDFPSDSVGLSLISPETEINIKEQGEYPSADVMIEAHKSVACFEIGCSNKSKNLLEYLNESKVNGGIADFKKISLNGVEGYETVRVGIGGHYTIFSEIPRGFFSIDFAFREDRKDFTVIENKIFSTLKFIKQ